MITAQAVCSEEHKLSVTGNASVFKPSDLLTLILGVETYHKDSNSAVEANAMKMKAVIESLQKIGLTEAEMQTKDFVILPQMTPSPKNPSPDWQPTIAGYQVRNTLNIRTNKLELAGEMINASSKVGGNYVQAINFSLLDEDHAKAEAISKAYQQAEMYAQSLAKVAGVQMGDVMELSIGHSFVGGGVYKAARMDSSVETPISARDVEVAASVSVIFNIKTKTQPNPN